MVTQPRRTSRWTASQSRWEKNPKKDFGEERALCGQPADFRFGDVELAGVAEQKQKIGGGITFRCRLFSVHLRQDLQGVCAELDNTNKRSCVGIAAVETEKCFAAGLVQFLQQILLRVGKPGDALVLEDGNRLHARRQYAPV
jgi:hypothetical protein